MENKAHRSFLLIMLALLLVVCSFGGGIATGYFALPRSALVPSPPFPETTPVSPTDAGTPPELGDAFGPFWEAWDIIHQQYVDQPLDDQVLVEGAIRGMMDSLGDPYSGYWDVRETTDANNAMQGEYDGIGSWVDTSGDYLTITQTMTGSPAEAAGLLSGDQIIAVDGEDVAGIDPDLVRLTRVLGPAGTDVTLTIRREGLPEPFDVTITRAHITVPSVESRMLDNNIAYIQLTIFGDNTASDFRDQLGDLMAQNPRGVILDLRNNGGGYLSAAVAVASEFIPSGVVLYEQYGDGTRQSYEARGGGRAYDVPVVVLVNEYSASASEIVAGALQDSGRAILVGTTTFGKGTVQNWLQISNGGTVRVTIARWLTPNGNTIHDVGLTPDRVVEMTADDVANDLDPQLDAAIDALINP